MPSRWVTRRLPALATLFSVLLPVLAIFACGSPGPIASNKPEQPANPASPAGTFANPVIDRDFADPDVLNVGDRYFASLGFGYNIKAIPGLSIDGAYSRQFVEEVNLKTKNVDRLGAASLDGKVDSKGEVVSLSATYAF